MAHRRSTATAAGSVGGSSLLERIPENILNEIFLKLQPETLTTLFSVACVSRTLQSSVNNFLYTLSSIDLSAFSLDSQTFNGIIKKFPKMKKITLDCLRLNDSSIRSFLGPHVEELTLLKCSSISCGFLSCIGRTCPNLRVLTVEFSGLIDKFGVFGLKLKGSLASCQCLESLQIKIRGGEYNDYSLVLLAIYHMLPQTVKDLKLHPTNGLGTLIYLRTFACGDLGIPIAPTTFGQTLTQLSLVLDVINDALLHTITRCLPLLIELDLKDRPTSEPFDDMSDLGVQSLVGCRHLISLSLVRSRQLFASASFKRTTDMGMFLLSEGCKGLESVRLGGFSKVSDAGYTSILNSSFNLKKFEIQNGFLLTDLAFQDVGKVPRSLVEVKLATCNITSDTVRELATCNSLEVLDLHGCRSVDDSCLGNVSCLTLLTCLNLRGADVTDAGLAVLGKGNAPISCLSLRGCTRVTDKGIARLLRSGGKIGETLSSLDLGHMPGITDDAITTIGDACIGLTELCIRNCFHVTDASIKVLAIKEKLRRLDLYNCTALTAECFGLLKKPLFRGLQWIGIGQTRLVRVGIYGERRWLTICSDGCEVGCHDGWQYHKFGS